jgi:hypothetical protein
MGFIQEKEIRAYQLKTHETVCPVCATEEEIKGVDEDKVLYREAEIHDGKGLVCTRCKKPV